MRESVIKSLLLHLGIIVFLVVSANFHMPAPKVMEVTLNPAMPEPEKAVSAVTVDQQKVEQKIAELKKQNIPILYTLHDFWLMCPRGQFLTRSIGKEENNQLCNKQENGKCASDCYQVYFSGNASDDDQDRESWTKWIHNRMRETKSIIEKVDHFIAPSNYLLERFVNEFSIPKNKITYLDYGFPTEYLTPSKKSKEKTKSTGKTEEITIYILQ